MWPKLRGLQQFSIAFEKVEIQVVKTSNKILDRATHLLEDWKLANTKKENCNDVMSDGKNLNVIHRVQQCRNYHVVQSWLCPPTERYKYNTDASFSSHYNREGHIMCIHDDEEGLCLQKKVWLALLCSVDIREVLGLYHIIIWIHEL